MLELILDRFASTACSANVQPSVSAHNCPRCHGIDLWQPYGTPEWYCVSCDPPPSKSMVANRLGSPTIVESIAYAIGNYGTHSMSFGGNRIEFPAFETHPICKCGSHMVTKHTWTDGIATFECSSCAAPIAAETVLVGKQA